ncbi:MAG: 50S ribosomal protein L3 [Chloroflexi bacterium]|nr:50S ribosomal protein L3 [Chloroflexota bacterium]
MTDDIAALPGLLGRKIGMTQVFLEDGTVVAVTAIEAGPCVITQVKARETDGYDALQLGYDPAKKLNSPEAGHLKKVEGKFRHLRELRLETPIPATIGQKVDASIFHPGDVVNVTGISKGKGFAGAVKRHHFAGGPRTHGQSDRERAPGAMGATTSPGRTLKGQRMAGHMGDRRVTVRGLSVIKADPEKNLLLVKGAAPGARNSLLLIRKTGVLA